MATLTQAMLTSLKNDIAANVTTITVTYDNGFQLVNQQIKNLPHDGTTANAIAAWYNLLPGTAFFANYSNVPLALVKGGIKGKNYTPTDAPPTAAVPSTPTSAETYALSLHTARTLFAQAFQLAVNNLLLAADSFDATNATLVSALQDATSTNMPTGAAGANQTGGWATTVKPAICRKASNAEKLLADTSGGNGSTNLLAATLLYDSGRDGLLTGPDIVNAWNS